MPSMLLIFEMNKNFLDAPPPPLGKEACKICMIYINLGINVPNRFSLCVKLCWQGKVQYALSMSREY